MIHILLVVVLLGAGMSLQSCGGDGSVNPSGTTINPVGFAIASKEIFAGSSALSVSGRKEGELLPGLLYGGNVIKSQAGLDLLWTHPVFANAAKPVVDFRSQSIVLYTAATGLNSKVLISRISSSQVIVSHCQTTATVDAILVSMVSMKLVDVVIDSTPKFEIQKSIADSC